MCQGFFDVDKEIEIPSLDLLIDIVSIMELEGILLANLQVEDSGSCLVT
jgi:hypothetical protein